MKELDLRTVKHELRTPVNHILGYSELLLESAQDDGDQALISRARNIYVEGQKLAALIDKNLVSLDLKQPEQMKTMRASFETVLDRIIQCSVLNPDSQEGGADLGDLQKIYLAARRLTVYLESLDTSCSLKPAGSPQEI